MRKRESHAVCLSVLIALLVVAPAFAITPYSLFTNHYDFNPWSPTEQADWTELRGGGPPAWDNTTTPGILSQSNLSADGWARWDLNGADPVGAVSAWTMEIRAQVTSQGAEIGNGDKPPAGLYFGLMNNAKLSTELVIQQTALQLRTSTGWVDIDPGTSNASYTTIRVVRYSTGVVQVYRDGLATPLGLGNYTTATSTSGYTSSVQFGDKAAYVAGVSDGLTTDIDYLAFDMGNAYVPEPATLMVLVSGMAVCLLRKRR